MSSATTPKSFSPPPPLSSARSAPPSRKVSTAAKTPQTAASPQNEQQPQPPPPPPATFPPPHVFDIIPPLYDILFSVISMPGTQQPGNSAPGEGGSVSSPLLKAPVPVHPQGLDPSLLAASPSLSTGNQPAAARSVGGGGSGGGSDAGIIPPSSLSASGLGLGLGLGTSTSASAATPVNPSVIDPKQLMVSASSVKIRIQKARSALENLPDMSRTVEQQEEEMEALDERIQRLKGIFNDFGRRSEDVLGTENNTRIEEAPASV